MGPLPFRPFPPREDVLEDYSFTSTCPLTTSVSINLAPGLCLVTVNCALGGTISKFHAWLIFFSPLGIWPLKKIHLIWNPIPAVCDLISFFCFKFNFQIWVNLIFPVTIPTHSQAPLPVLPWCFSQSDFSCLQAPGVGRVGSAPSRHPQSRLSWGVLSASQVEARTFPDVCLFHGVGETFGNWLITEPPWSAVTWKS